MSMFLPCATRLVKTTRQNINFYVWQQIKNACEILSQFRGYCHLVWMFHSKTLRHRINRIHARHERGLRLSYIDYISTFEHLLELDKSVTIHSCEEFANAFCRNV